MDCCFAKKADAFEVVGSRLPRLNGQTAYSLRSGPRDLVAPERKKTSR